MRIFERIEEHIRKLKEDLAALYERARVYRRQEDASLDDQIASDELEEEGDVLNAELIEDIELEAHLEAQTIRAVPLEIVPDLPETEECH